MCVALKGTLFMNSALTSEVLRRTQTGDWCIVCRLVLCFRGNTNVVCVMDGLRMRIHTCGEIAVYLKSERK